MTSLYCGSSPYYEKHRPCGMRSNRSTCGEIVMTMFTLVLMFVTVSGFCIMMYQGDVTYLLEALLFLFVFVIIFLAIKDRSSSIQGMGYADAYSHWFFLLVALTGLAWVLGVCSGELNYLNNFWPYYSLGNKFRPTIYHSGLHTVTSPPLFFLECVAGWPMPPAASFGPLPFPTQA